MLPKTQQYNLDDVLNSAIKTDVPKSKVPLLSVSEETKKLVSEIRKLKQEMDNLKSICKIKEQELLKIVAPERERLCLQGYISSVKVPSADKLSVRITWRDQYSKIGLEQVPLLEGIIKDKFSQYFTVDMVITVKNNSETALNELIQAVGPTRFAEFFTVQKTIKPTNRYTTEFFTAFTPEEREKLRSIVKQYEPSIST